METQDVLPLTTTTDEQRRAADIAVLPIGSFEQHGPHLPLCTDTVIAGIVTTAVTAAHPVLRLPPVTISCSHEHEAWPGTVSISATTLAAIVTDVASSLRRSGVHTLVLINAHGGNYGLANVVQQANAEGHRTALFPGKAAWRRAHAAAGIETPSEVDMHAGEVETSLLLHAHPELVRPGYESADHLTGDREHLLTWGLAAYTDSGVVGRPSAASADKGRALLDSLVESFTDLLAALADGPS